MATFPSTLQLKAIVHVRHREGNRSPRQSSAIASLLRAIAFKLNPQYWERNR
ncbi:hypothetical protein [Mastigocladopsis repens]|uniref:hypothetical protein n=1 Tax=Mastigocladopsis repens TaxID=221287 RepID=UPI0003723523|nr:hypothetical protein [Mastigocladopsis repens]